MTFPRVTDHPTLAAFARELADHVEEGEPRRIYGALADLWQAVAAGRPLPPMKAQRWEIRAQLAFDIPRARGVAREGLEALLFFHTPPGGGDVGKPLIVLVHDINLSRLALRVAHAQSPLEKGGSHVDRSPQRASHSQQATAGRSTAVATQAGLL